MNILCTLFAALHYLAFLVDTPAIDWRARSSEQPGTILELISLKLRRLLSQTITRHYPHETNGRIWNAISSSVPVPFLKPTALFSAPPFQGKFVNTPGDVAIVGGTGAYTGATGIGHFNTIAANLATGEFTFGYNLQFYVLPKITLPDLSLGNGVPPVNGVCTPGSAYPNQVSVNLEVDWARESSFSRLGTGYGCVEVHDSPT
jgi:hypothetical protein